MFVTRWLLVLLMLAPVGCAPRIHVRKNPTDQDKGIRYYRPKPYLLVTPSGVYEKGSAVSSPVYTRFGDQLVALELRYLPDYSEEYSIEVKPGLGSAHVQIALEDGWNLTSINQNLDSQTDENIRAVAELAKAVGGIVGTSGQPSVGQSTQVADNVAARNVPIGFYEAVIGRDHCGRKALYGWRYIGFVPFATCPIRTGGEETSCCNDGSLELFGLVFENGVMTFRLLNDVQQIPNKSSSLNNVGNAILGTASSNGFPDGNSLGGADPPTSAEQIQTYANALQQHLSTLLVEPTLEVRVEGQQLSIYTHHDPREVRHLLSNYLLARPIGNYQVQVAAP